jgi:MinD-like ATPase involved in chromosome partitioning or flagellar assembly
MTPQPNDPLSEEMSFDELFTAPNSESVKPDDKIPPSEEISEDTSSMAEPEETTSEAPVEAEVVEETPAPSAEPAPKPIVEPAPEVAPEPVVSSDPLTPEPASVEDAPAMLISETPAPETPVPETVQAAAPAEKSSSLFSDEERQKYESMMQGITERMATLSQGIAKVGGEEPVQSEDLALPAPTPEREEAARQAQAAAPPAISAEEQAAEEEEARKAAEEASAKKAAEDAAAEEAAVKKAAEEEEARKAAEEETERLAAEEASRVEASRVAEEQEALRAAERESAEANLGDIGDSGFEDLTSEQPEDLDVGPKLNLPADSPFADEVPQGKRVSPDSNPAQGINDYEPAYAELDDAEEDMSAPLTGPSSASQAQANEPLPEPQSTGESEVHEPMDLLWAIAVVDPEAEAAQREQQVVRRAAQGAAKEERLRSGKKQKLKLDRLPFDSLVAGTPLIATIFSPSGGVGKSSTAMNLAVYIAAIADAMAKQVSTTDQPARVPRVLLLDGDVVQGSLALRLKHEVTPSMHTLMLYLDDRFEAGFVGADRWPRVYSDAVPGERSMRDFVMWPETLPNLNLLAAPDDPDLFYDFGPKEYREILQLLSKYYDVIIIDAGTEIVMESNRAWLQHANEVFLITAPEIDRIYNASKAARYIATSRTHPQDDSPDPKKLPPLVTADRLSVVMTRFDTDVGIDPEMLMDESFPWLKDRPDQKFAVPDVAQEMTRANNTGRFLVLEDPAYAKVIGRIAKHLFARYDSQKPRSLPPA